MIRLTYPHEEKHQLWILTFGSVTVIRIDKSDISLWKPV